LHGATVDDVTVVVKVVDAVVVIEVVAVVVTVEYSIVNPEAVKKNPLETDIRILNLKLDTFAETNKAEGRKLRDGADTLASIAWTYNVTRNDVLVITMSPHTTVAPCLASPSTASAFAMTLSKISFWYETL
jgi:hypothetical protein